jgi:hypothetical protein
MPIEQTMPRRTTLRPVRGALLALLTVALLWIAPLVHAQEGQPELVQQQTQPTPGLVNANFSEARIEQVLTLISAQAGVSITPLGRAVGERVTVFERDADVETVLNKIAQPKGWTWWQNDDGSYGIADEEWYRPTSSPSRPSPRSSAPTT